MTTDGSLSTAPLDIAAMFVRLPVLLHTAVHSDNAGKEYRLKL